MCGIVGYNMIDKGTDNKAILALATAMLYFASSRGKDATGYMTCDKQGNTTYCKAPLKALDFIKQGGMKFDKVPKTFIGHTRASTSGSPLFNYNNHPLIRDKVGLVHNGFIPLWQNGLKYKGLRDKMRTHTDSELFSVYIEEHDVINDMDEFIDGSFALAYMYWNEGVPYLVRNRSPLVYADMTSIIGATFFASTEEIITQAIHAVFKEFPEDELNIVAVPAYQLFKLKDGVLEFLYELNKRKPDTYIYPGTRNLQPYNNYKNTKRYIQDRYSNPNANVPIGRVDTDTISSFYARIDNIDKATELLQRFANMYYADANPWQTRTPETAELLMNQFLRVYDTT